ncbi:hypothetical protein ABK040_000038 [Willaertia magna]
MRGYRGLLKIKSLFLLMVVALLVNLLFFKADIVVKASDSPFVDTYLKYLGGISIRSTRSSFINSNSCTCSSCVIGFVMINGVYTIKISNNGTESIDRYFRLFPNEPSSTELQDALLMEDNQNLFLLYEDKACLMNLNNGEPRCIERAKSWSYYPEVSEMIVPNKQFISASEELVAFWSVVDEKTDDDAIVKSLKLGKTYSPFLHYYNNTMIVKSNIDKYYIIGFDKDLPKSNWKTKIMEVDSNKESLVDVSVIDGTALQQNVIFEGDYMFMVKVNSDFSLNVASLNLKTKELKISSTNGTISNYPSARVVTQKERDGYKSYILGFELSIHWTTAQILNQQKLDAVTTLMDNYPSVLRSINYRYNLKIANGGTCYKQPKFEGLPNDVYIVADNYNAQFYNSMFDTIYHFSLRAQLHVDPLPETLTYGSSKLSVITLQSLAKNSQYIGLIRYNPPNQMPRYLEYVLNYPFEVIPDDYIRLYPTSTGSTIYVLRRTKIIPLGNIFHSEIELSVFDVASRKLSRNVASFQITSVSKTSILHVVQMYGDDNYLVLALPDSFKVFDVKKNSFQNDILFSISKCTSKEILSQKDVFLICGCLFKADISQTGVNINYKCIPKYLLASKCLTKMNGNAMIVNADSITSIPLSGMGPINSKEGNVDPLVKYQSDSFKSKKLKLLSENTEQTVTSCASGASNNLYIATPLLSEIQFGRDNLRDNGELLYYEEDNVVAISSASLVIDEPPSSMTLTFTGENRLHIEVRDITKTEIAGGISGVVVGGTVFIVILVIAVIVVIALLVRRSRKQKAAKKELLDNNSNPNTQPLYDVNDGGNDTAYAEYYYDEENRQ